MKSPKSMPQDLRNLGIYPQYVQQLLSVDGFISAYYEELKFHDRYFDAYETIERVHLHFFGKRKYSNYASFQQVMSRKTNK